MNRLALARLFIVLLTTVACFALPACKRRKPPVVPRSEITTAAQTTPTATSTPHEQTSPGQDVYAAWYDVPLWSLAKKRAGLEELTAAHNTLPLGTRVRVTHLANGKSVVVRVTDRGIHDRKVKIDVCKEAAQELGMVGEGIARVRMQVLQENEPSGAGASPEVALAQP
jgi:rare lipoprotein A